MNKNRRLDKAALTGPSLKPWDSGKAVVELQELLCAHGFKLRLDGSYGWLTETAVKEYQQQQGLRIDGIVGAKTWAALKSTVRLGSRVLKLGHTGLDVYELQGLLQIHGYVLLRDGIFGERTQAAVLAFQRRYRLKDTSMADSITCTALRGDWHLPRIPDQTEWYFIPQRWW